MRCVGMELDKSEITEVVDRKNGMGMDAYEWIENIDAIRNENQERVVMRVMEMKWDGKEDGIINRSV